MQPFSSFTTNYTMTVADEKTSAAQLQDELDALNAKVTKQGSRVRELKKNDGSADEIAEAVSALQALKIAATEMADQLAADQPVFNRKAFDDLVVRKMFVVPSFEIHGGVKGLYDLGPPACSVKVRRKRLDETCDGCLPFLSSN
jgi:glycyl-tRNA synthetase